MKAIERGMLGGMKLLHEIERRVELKMAEEERQALERVGSLNQLREKTGQQEGNAIAYKIGILAQS